MAALAQDEIEGHRLNAFTASCQNPRQQTQKLVLLPASQSADNAPFNSERCDWFTRLCPFTSETGIHKPDAC